MYTKLLPARCLPLHPESMQKLFLHHIFLELGRTKETLQNQETSMKGIQEMNNGARGASLLSKKRTVVHVKTHIPHLKSKLKLALSLLIKNSVFFSAFGFCSTFCLFDSTQRLTDLFLSLSKSE